MTARLQHLISNTTFEDILVKVRFALIAILLFVLPLIMYLGNTTYGYTKLIFAIIFVSLILLVWAAEMAIKGSYTCFLTELILPAGILVMVSFLSLINAKSIGAGLETIAVLIFFFFIYLLIANTVKNKGDIQILVGVLLLSAVLACLYGLLQYYGVVPGAPGKAGGSSAIISSVGNKNYLGGFVAYLFVPSLILLLISERRWIKILTILALGIIYLTLIPISSDGAWGSLVISAVFLLMGMAFFKLFSLLSKNRPWVIALLGVLILAYLAQGAPGPLNSLLSYSAVNKSEEKGWLSSVPVVGRLSRKLRGVRSEDWWVGWEMFKDHPILGIGIGNYKVRFLEYKGIFRATERSKRFNFYIKRAAQAHNEYVQMGSELGIVGILALGFAAFMIFSSGIRRIIGAKLPKEKFILLAFLSGIVALLVHATISFPLHLPASTLDLVLFLGIINSGAFAGKEDDDKKTSPLWKNHKLDLKKPAIWIIISLLLVFVISVSVLAYRDWLSDVYLDKGVKELQMGRNYTAREEFNRSFMLSFHPREVLFYLGVVNQQLGDIEKAEQFFKKSLNTFMVESTFLQLASMNFQKKDYSQSLKYLNALLRIDPEDTREIQARFMIALIDLKQGRVKEALSKLDELIAKHSSFERAYMARAEIYKGQGRISQAKDDLTKALAIIEKKLKRNKRRLQVGSKLTRDEYAQIRTDIETLEKEKKSVEESLKPLGFD